MYSQTENGVLLKILLNLALIKTSLNQGLKIALLGSGNNTASYACITQQKIIFFPKKLIED